MVGAGYLNAARDVVVDARSLVFSCSNRVRIAANAVTIVVVVVVVCVGFVEVEVEMFVDAVEVVVVYVDFLVFERVVELAQVVQVNDVVWRDVIALMVGVVAACVVDGYFFAQF